MRRSCCDMCCCYRPRRQGGGGDFLGFLLCLPVYGYCIYKLIGG